ncbi:MAG: hypothetical protein M5U28_15070 [Sandaracinaceae bacterium]|nr:hypothetical protein [Sandaracinaceae bacterium]
MTTTRPLFTALLLLSACDAPAARSCSEPCEPLADGGADAGGSPGALAIVPGDAELRVTEGSSPSLRLRAVTHEHGREVEVAAAWEAEPRLVATVDPSAGVLTATGSAGGRVTVRASAPGGETATATVTVRVERATRGPGVTDADLAALEAAPLAALPDPVRVLYPLDGAVMPQNVLPPDVQWDTGAVGDVLRVVLSTPHVRIEHVERERDASFERAWSVDPEAWRILARSDLEGGVTVEVDRLHGGELHRALPVRVRLARGALPGSAYYWSIAEGRILRVDDADGRRTDVIPHPPEVRGDSERCVGCHAISPSGRWMAASMGNGRENGVRVAAVFDLTSELARDPAPTLFSTAAGYSGVTWSQAAWSPDERRLVVERDLRLALVDPFSGRDVPLAEGAWPAAITVQPEWSPDGHRIAYVRASSWTVDFSRGDVAVVDVLGPDAIGGERVLHAGTSLSGAPEGGEADSYPTFSPDSRRVAFAHGTGSYSAASAAALYLMDAGGENVVRLAHASGEGGDSFAPRFAPVTSGGYHWLAFHSHRPYGNDRRGRVEEGERERTHGVWIAAVRADAAPGEDPSEVPYFLPGQDPRTSNISVAWTRRACREDGEGCALGSECCSGECASSPGGALVCNPPPPDRCRARGETCDGGGCCAGLACFEHVCVDDLF